MEKDGLRVERTYEGNQMKEEVERATVSDSLLQEYILLTGTFFWAVKPRTTVAGAVFAILDNCLGSNEKMNPPDGAQRSVALGAAKSIQTANKHYRSFWGAWAISMRMGWSNILIHLWSSKLPWEGRPHDGSANSHRKLLSWHSTSQQWMYKCEVDERACSRWRTIFEASCKVQNAEIWGHKQNQGSYSRNTWSNWP